MDSNKIAKMFSVLVIGGSMMAHASESFDSVETSEENSHCQLEVALNKYDTGGNLALRNTTCIDSMNSEEILKVIEEGRKDSCLTPFCGCWLG